MTSFFAAFPERQILIRTDGRVRFFVFRSWLQIAMAGVTFLLAGTVLFISVGVVLQGRIIAAEHSRLREAQAQAQALYDEHAAAIQGFEAQQNALAAIIERKQEVESALSFPAGGSSANSPRVTTSSESTNEADAHTAKPVKTGSPIEPSEAAEADPAQSRPEDFVTALIHRLEEFFRPTSGLAKSPDPSILYQHEPQQSSMMELKERQLALLRELDHSIESDSKRFHETLQNVGLAPEAFIARANATAEEPAESAGPLVTSPDLVADSRDREYLGELENASTSLDALTNVIKGMNAVPLRRPIDADYGSASGFGKRRDPFTKQIAFHSGLDLSGPWGSPVRATAAGFVVYAGRKGGYGNMIEIDHGYGIRTRYGHLRSTSVRTGAFVEQGTQVGSLGSTGRSTGPHVHYEVWYENAPKDPRKFINAGQRILQE